MADEADNQPQSPDERLRRFRPRDFRKRPSDLKRPLDDSKEKTWFTVRGVGHFDRFYFSNCTFGHHMSRPWGFIYPYQGGNAIEVEGPGVPPMANGAIFAPEPKVQTRHVELFVHIEHNGVWREYRYIGRIPENCDDNIVCAVFGLTEAHNGTEIEIVPYGVLLGHEGSYCDIEVYCRWI